MRYCHLLAKFVHSLLVEDWRREWNLLDKLQDIHLGLKRSPRNDNIALAAERVRSRALKGTLQWQYGHYDGNFPSAFHRLYLGIQMGSRSVYTFACQHVLLGYHESVDHDIFLVVEIADIPEYSGRIKVYLAYTY